MDSSQGRQTKRRYWMIFIRLLELPSFRLSLKTSQAGRIICPRRLRRGRNEYAKVGLVFSCWYNICRSKLKTIILISTVLDLFVIVIVYWWAKKSYPKWSSWETPRTYLLTKRGEDFSAQRVNASLSSYVDQKFLQSYKATVGADFMEKEVIVDGKVINLEVGRL